MNHIILIGGHDALISNYSIEDYIISLCDNPNILFFPTAARDNIKNINAFNSLFKKYNCNINHLLLWSNPQKKEIEEKIANADILYFGGGNTLLLVDKLKEYGIDNILFNTNKILVGISAGAIMLSKYGMGDSFSYFDNGHTYNYKMVEGLGILDITICPHYQNEDLVIYNEEVKNYPFDGYAIENECAIDFYNNTFKIIKANTNNSIYRFRKESDYIMESLYNKNKIAVLGPAGTFCDMAFNKYNNIVNNEYMPVYYPSIKKTIEAIDDVGIALLPFENSLDGYVVETVDKLIKSNYHILCDLEQKIEFAFVSNAKKIEDIKNVFVQFKAKGECIDFLTSQNNFNLIMTETNMESFNRLIESDNTYGAIIPLNKVSDSNFNIVINNVDDKENNYTRFIVVSKTNNNYISNNIKYSLSVLRKSNDKPGLLFGILKSFNDYKVNLTAILSRPTKEALGHYNFYIEISAKKEEIENINKCIKELESDDYIVKVLGSYSLLG